MEHTLATVLAANGGGVDSDSRESNGESNKARQSDHVERIKW